MPYKLAKPRGGYKVTSPNHPHGFSKHPMSKKKALSQMRLLEAVEHNPNFKMRK
jgi:hypothetical protein